MNQSIDNGKLTPSQYAIPEHLETYYTYGNHNSNDYNLDRIIFFAEKERDRIKDSDFCKKYYLSMIINNAYKLQEINKHSIEISNHVDYEDEFCGYYDLIFKQKEIKSDYYPVVEF